MKKDKFIDFNTEKNDEVCLDIDPKEFRINERQGDGSVVLVE